MTRKHTPAPWKIFNHPEHNKIKYIRHSNMQAHNEICVMYSEGSQDENAHLIAAAPELLEALEGECGIIDTIDYVLPWLKTELKTIEARCNNNGVTGAHKDSAMCGVQVAINNLLIVKKEAQKAVAKARGES